MTRWLAVAFFVAHGLLHVAMWTPPPAQVAPFATHGRRDRRVWRVVVVALALLAGVGFAACGIGYLTEVGWWPHVALGACAVSIVLMLLTFTPLWLGGLVIDLVIAAAAVRALA